MEHCQSSPSLKWVQHGIQFIEKLKVRPLPKFFRVMELTLAQKFKLEILKKDIENLTKEEAQKYLLEMFRQMMVKDNLFKELIKKA